METPRNADSAGGSAPGSGVPSALADFVRDAEQTLDDEVRLAVMSPPSAAVSTSTGDMSDVSSEKGQGPEEKSTSDNVSLQQQIDVTSTPAVEEPAASDGRSSAGMPPSASSTAQQTQIDTIESPYSPLMSMKAAKNTMLVAANQVKYLFGDTDQHESDAAAVHEFDGLYSLQLASQLRELYRSKTLCDIKIDCDGQTFDFQRVILSCGSGYFRRLLEEDPTMSAHKLQFDPTIDPATFDVIAESLYTGAVTRINYETSIPLLKAAFFLEVEHATAQCTEFLLSELDDDNCLEIWKAARFCSSDKLLVASSAMIGRHLPTVVSTDLFVDLPTAMLIDLLSNDGLEVPNEMVVYEAAIAWTRHDTSNREGLLAQVLKVVRFPYLSKKYLTEVVATEELIMSNHDAMHMYSRAMRYKLAGRKFAHDETPAKRRDHIKYEIHGGYERYQKEQKIKRQMARDAPPDTRSLEERVTDMRDNFIRMFQEHLILNKFVMKPFIFCKDQVFVKHIVAPIKQSPCVPNKTSDDDDDDEDWNSRNALAAPEGPDMTVPHEESFFIKYIARPIEKSPCMPDDSDDEYDEDEEDDSPVGSPVKEDSNEVDPGLLEVLDDSVWTKYKVNVQKPQEA